MLDNLGNVLWLITLVIVVGCALWGAVMRLVIRRRVRQALREFQPATETELLQGFAELRQAIHLQQQRDDITRDVHRRTWR